MTQKNHSAVVSAGTFTQVEQTDCPHSLPVSNYTSNAENLDTDLFLHKHDATLWMWSPTARRILYTTEWPHILGQTRDIKFPSSISLEGYLASICEEDRPRFRQLIEQIRSGSIQHIDISFRVRRNDGGWAWSLTRGVVYRQNNQLCLGGINVNISRLRSDPLFQQSATGVGDDLYHTILENSPDLMVRLDRELFPLYINPMVSRYLAREKDELSGTEAIDELGMDPEQLAFLQENIRRVFAENIAIRKMVTFTTAHGYPATGEYSFWPECDNDGAVIAVMTQFRDLTEQARVKELARLSESRLEALNRLAHMESASEEEVLKFVLSSMSELTDSASGFIFIPDAKLTGKGRMYWSKGSLAYKHTHVPGNDLLPPNLLCPPHLANERNKLDAQKIPAAECLLRIDNGTDDATPLFTLADGKLPVFRYVTAPAFEDDRVVCLAGVCNKKRRYDESDLRQISTFINGAWLILRRYRHIQELQQAKKAAEAADKARATFLANVNHELRTPLSSILGYAETLRNLPPGQEDFAKRCLEAIQRNAEQMHKLVEDLLVLSRMESTMPLKLGMVPLKELVVRITDAMLPQDEAERPIFQFTIPPDLRVRADGHSLSQVLRNLLENACRYSPPGLPIEVTARHQGNDIAISVRDHGCGIAPGDRTRVFERFYSGQSTGGRQHSSGLGLSICKHVVERHGGRIWVEDAYPGALFCFTLPCAPPE